MKKLVLPSVLMIFLLLTNCNVFAPITNNCSFYKNDIDSFSGKKNQALLVDLVDNLNVFLRFDIREDSKGFRIRTNYRNNAASSRTIDEDTKMLLKLQYGFIIELPIEKGFKWVEVDHRGITGNVKAKVMEGFFNLSKEDIKDLTMTPVTDIRFVIEGENFDHKLSDNKSELLLTKFKCIYEN